MTRIALSVLFMLALALPAAAIKYQQVFDNVLVQGALYVKDVMTFSGAISLANGETIDNATDDMIEFQGVGGTDNTDLRLDLDGTYPVLDSPTDASIGIGEALVVTEGITLGGGYGSTGCTLSTAGVAQCDGAITSGGTITATSTFTGAAATTYDAGGAAGITIGSADVTALTVTTDGTGTAEVALPAGSIDSTEVLDATLVCADTDDGAGADGLACEGGTLVWTGTHQFDAAITALASSTFGNAAADVLTFDTATPGDGLFSDSPVLRLRVKHDPAGAGAEATADCDIFVDATADDGTRNLVIDCGGGADEFSMTSAGALTIAGDLVVSGDDIRMATNTDAFILVANGTEFSPVAMSDDATISNTGVVTVADLTCTDCIGVTEIADSYLLNNGDATTGDINYNDGTTDSPKATFTPQTGTAWSVYAEDATDDLQVESNTASVEVVDFVNAGAGTVDVTIDGDLTVSGGQFAMAVNTAGNLLVGNAGGTAFESVAVSGNATMTSTGALTVTDVTCTDCLTATEITDVYVLNAGDAMTGNLELTDGVTDTPSLVLTPQTGTAWSVYVEDGADDLQVEANTASGETVDLNNIGAGTVSLALDGSVTSGGTFTATGAAIYDAGGANTIVIGSADVTSITLTTDGSGTGEVVLPLQSIAGAEIVNDTIDGTELADSIALDAALAFVGTAGEVVTFTRTLTDATAENGVLISVTALDTTSGTANQFGIAVANAASTEGLDGAFSANNLDADDAVLAMMVWSDSGGGGYTQDFLDADDQDFRFGRSTDGNVVFSARDEGVAVTWLTVDPDGAGADAQVQLPTGSVSSGEILDGTIAAADVADRTVPISMPLGAWMGCGTADDDINFDDAVDAFPDYTRGSAGTTTGSLAIEWDVTGGSLDTQGMCYQITVPQDYVSGLAFYVTLLDTATNDHTYTVTTLVQTPDSAEDATTAIPSASNGVGASTTTTTCDGATTPSDLYTCIFTSEAVTAGAIVTFAFGRLAGTEATTMFGAEARYTANQ